MVKSGAVWQIPVMPSPTHRVLAATITAPAITISASTNMQDVERMHEVLCCAAAGTTMMLRYYKYYHATGFEKASMAEVQNFRCPIKALMQGDAKPKRRRPHTSSTGTTDVHACGTLRQRGQCLCVLCRSAAETRPYHCHTPRPPSTPPSAERAKPKIATAANRSAREKVC